MPCDSGPSPSNWDLMEDKLDKATFVACELAKLLTHKQLQMMSSVAADWIAEHNRLDQEREEKANIALRREGIKMAALRKLTSEEREALGVR